MAETETVAAETYLGDDGAFQEGWLDGLPEDTFEKDDTGKAKQGDLAEHKTIGSVVKSYLNKDKLLGTAIQPLAEDATLEQKRAHFTKLGCPEKVEGYEIPKPQLPEGMVYDDETIKAATQYAYDNGAPKGLFEGLAKVVIEGQMKKYGELVTADKTAQEEAAKTAQQEKDKAIEAAENQLKTKHGAEYDTVLEMANRGHNMPGNEEVNKAFVDLIENSTTPEGKKGLSSHPAMVEFMYHFYKDFIKESEVPGGGGPAGKGGTPGQLDYSEVVGNSGK